MKKLTALMMTLLLFLSVLPSVPAMAEDQKISVVTTIFPIWDWVCGIAGEYADVTLLLDKGVDLHSYQPTAQDILNVSSADVFIHVGGESDKWVQDVLKEAVNQNMRVVNLMEILGEAVKEEETVEGMQEEEHDHDEEQEEESDEHVWLSLRSAQTMVQAIADVLSAADEAHSDIYQANAGAYIQKLAELDARYIETVENAEYRVLLFADRFPFRYLTDDYGLTYYAAFSGCSAETEASFETIVFLAKKLEELELPAVITIENSDCRVAETVISASSAKDLKILTLNSLQGKQQEQDTYLSVMEENLAVLAEALNK